jgi:DNA-binding NarL/FixJ family response regulator
MAPQPKASSRTIRVLLVDDEPLILEVLQARFEEVEDIEVIGKAQSGRAALSLIERHQPDVVILDLAMPRMDGLEVARHLRDAVPDVGVVILTAYATPEAERLLRGLGVRAFVSKTAPGAELLAAIRGAARPSP